MGQPYCKPWNAGLESETGAVCRRLGRLMDALADEINSNVVDGEILEDVRAFRLILRERLEAEGWTFGYQGGERMKVRQPGHKKPFTRPQ